MFTALAARMAARQPRTHAAPALTPRPHSRRASTLLPAAPVPCPVVLVTAPVLLGGEPLLGPLRVGAHRRRLLAYLERPLGREADGGVVRMLFEHLLQRGERAGVGERAAEGKRRRLTVEDIVEGGEKGAARYRHALIRGVAPQRVQRRRNGAGGGERLAQRAARAGERAPADEHLVGRGRTRGVGLGAESEGGG